MIDTKINAYGDFTIANGDLQLTGQAPSTDEEDAACLGQLAYFALKTDLTDFVLHPELGNEAKKLLGMPNKPKTAELGKDIILRALRAMGITNRIDIKSWPEDLNTIAYEVSITVASTGRALMLVLRHVLGE